LPKARFGSRCSVLGRDLGLKSGPEVWT
jgi:hypothetical protein